MTETYQLFCIIFAIQKTQNSIIMPTSRNWTREEIIVALNLYCKIPFKESRATHPLVKQYAELIGRSPAAMNLKIGNLGRLDPTLRARGITGLSNGRVQHCNNCGIDFTGNFCPICSQKAGMGRIGWKSVRQGIMDIWGLGTRSLLYSIWQLLWRPGQVIGDYLDGKRQVSFPPVKMLFIIAVIYSVLFYWFFPTVLGIEVLAVPYMGNLLLI